MFKSDIKAPSVISFNSREVINFLRDSYDFCKASGQCQEDA